ncbi:S-layer homology domain-containing protein [Pseudoflavonifractor phocaeensis]|uniref:S-layer homology domain-containing protein n=1 Tax=Pseudoflavonifractor phocaeensis TaxID=1870988 RepID=UPI00195E9F62|nr:S-layer homology domain-containing protein [Pseudoflavonifractor phocaeensis]MBM6870143.1 S-layer homology domain-containing protein [Pseudoflavonifractor phocaeensis]
MNRILRPLAAAALAVSLTVPSLAAGMSSFSPSISYTPFPDVADSAWYAPYVQQVVELGLMNGKSGGVFDPNGTLTLGEAVTMAAKTCAIYEGDPVPTTDCQPWYQNAVNYALEQGILTRGEYKDYTAPATRADMAGLFAWALPATELTRINRIGDLMDVDQNTDSASEIYLLYNAGVLTGNEAGAFQPENTIDRASAAAILTRLALPESRKTVVSTSYANSVESPDGVYRVNVPQGWQSKFSGNVFTAAGNGQKVTITTAGRTQSLDEAAISHLDGLVSAQGGVNLTIQPGYDLFRGLAAVSFGYVENGLTHAVYVVENSQTTCVIDLAWPEGGDLTALLGLMDSFDLAM